MSCSAPCSARCAHMLCSSCPPSPPSCREGITRGDVEEVHELFHDAKYSARLLAEQADKYVL